MLRPYKRSPLPSLVRRYASSAESKYPVGTNIHGYVVERVQPIPEFSLVAVQLKHQKTGAVHLHLDAPHDRNNVFSVAFKTNPPDATGVPHILEHTTLCGSHKYPVRNPFFKMLNRSLSNFMNAMTGHDYTFYPFATTNPRDFHNLMDVYLSSVFEPLLTYEDFAQEGWRLEQSDLSDKNSPMTFKGVVYNEMKGQYSDSSYYFYIKFQEAIYSSLNNSGGDPTKMTALQYEDLLDFHANNYHPSNSKTFTYGNMSLPPHLDKLNQMFQNYGARSSKPVVRQPVFASDPRLAHDVVITGPVDTVATKPASEQYQASVTWHLGNPLDEAKRYDLFKWKILGLLLCDGHNSPFYQELIESQFGEDFSVNTGLDSTTALMSFTMGLNNLSESKVDALEAKINDVFVNKVIPELEAGKYHDRVEAILHQIELSFKKHKPEFGLGLLSSVVSTWVNGMDPISTLQVERILTQFKQDYAANGHKVFISLLEQMLDEQTPKFKFTMKPDENFAKNLVKEEAQRLEEKTKGLDEHDKQVILDRSKVLAEKQQTEEDVSVLPTLTVWDIPREGERYPLLFSDNKFIQKRIVDSNGLVYVNAAKDISYLPPKYYKYMPLFNSCLTGLAGTSKTPITELETKIQKLTGGVLFSLSAKTDPFNIGRTKLHYVMTGMSLKENAPHIYELWLEILNDTKFTTDGVVVDKLSTLIKNMGQNQMNNIAERGHSYAASNSHAQLTPTKWITAQTSGLEQVRFVLELNQKLEQHGKQYLIDEVLPILQEIRQLVLNGYTDKGFRYSVIGDASIVAENEKLISTFDKQLEQANAYEQKPDELAGLVSSFKPGLGTKSLVNLPFQVGYASSARLGAAYTTADGAALQVLSQMLTFKHLHSVIRESNGAYGGGLSYDGLGGTLNYYSYRDPNAVQSVKLFGEASQVAIERLVGTWTDDDLQEAKLAIFQSVDAPSHLSSQGSSAFLEGITDDMRQERRERFLDMTMASLHDAAEKYLVNDDVVTVIGDNEILKVDGSWKVVAL